MANQPLLFKPEILRGRDGDLNLVFGTRDTEHNNAAVLKSNLEKRLP